MTNKQQLRSYENNVVDNLLVAIAAENKNEELKNKQKQTCNNDK